MIVVIIGAQMINSLLFVAFLTKELCFTVPMAKPTTGVAWVALTLLVLKLVQSQESFNSTAAIEENSILKNLTRDSRGQS